jgi:hypothetical protein
MRKKGVCFKNDVGPCCADEFDNVGRDVDVMSALLYPREYLCGKSLFIVRHDRIIMSEAIEDRNRWKCLGIQDNAGTDV